MRHAQLDLGYNNIGPEGAAAIGEALKVNGSLKEVCSATPTRCCRASLVVVCCVQLNLQENYFGAEGAKAIGEALKLNGSLKNVR